MVDYSSYVVSTSATS